MDTGKNKSFKKHARKRKTDVKKERQNDNVTEGRSREIPYD
jgi:hypothetical protein